MIVFDIVVANLPQCENCTAMHPENNTKNENTTN